MFLVPLLQHRGEIFRELVRHRGFSTLIGTKAIPTRPVIRQYSTTSRVAEELNYHVKRIKNYNFFSYNFTRIQISQHDKC